MILQGREIFGGHAEGEALVSGMGISFYGGVDPGTGIIMEKGHDLEGECIAGKVLVFPSGKGSTVGSYTLYRLKKNNRAPSAIINQECEVITAVGCIISEIPCVDQVDVSLIHNGDLIQIEAGSGRVHLLDIHPRQG